MDEVGIVERGFLVCFLIWRIGIWFYFFNKKPLLAEPSSPELEMNKETNTMLDREKWREMEGKKGEGFGRMENLLFG